MPVYPFDPVPAVKSGDYPHMASRDVTVWERWLDQFGGELLGVVYDVALGGMEPPEDAGDERMKRAWRYSTAIKVDAVALAEGGTLVIEVKPRASLSAIGQALGAATMMELDNPTNYEPTPCVVTDECTPDVRYVCDQLGVVLYEVGFDESILTIPPVAQ